MERISVNKKIKKIIDLYKIVPDFFGCTLTDVNTRNQFSDQLIHIVSVSGNVDDIQVLLECGADINSKGEGGFTPLHYAAEQNKFELISFLLNNGASMCLVNDDNLSPLELADMLDNVKSKKVFEKWLNGYGSKTDI